MVVSDKVRRVAWGIYLIDALGAPPSSEWTERLGTVYTIMQQFKVPRGSRDSVLNLLEDNVGLIKMIALHTCEIQIVADCVELGMGLTKTTHMVNEYRAVHNRVHVGRNAVYSSYLRLKPVVTPLYRQKQGSADKDSEWAKARHRLAQEFATRLGIWELD
ncbi:hypothetical protein H257_09941 [Aphanomyces astaci]|uniref:Uncharacterized protein n=1 Tax=Aphanomyces astaci TaxID=112090 RepID=W4G8F8_APHAT|nr:hypothetical protein H257_09941 [Aphanomyces astaci]ETV75987.1 hypothetical protein H257_09941 [Aphanomyces astaci]|eukprot:XP_009834629.1 hypothetical protein H257_09941 [Aphanomyces astaci]